MKTWPLTIETSSQIFNAPNKHNKKKKYNVRLFVSKCAQNLDLGIFIPTCHLEELFFFLFFSSSTHVHDWEGHMLKGRSKKKEKKRSSSASFFLLLIETCELSFAKRG